MGDGIRAYTGEFTLVPWGLELSMNFCSHACSYCFANHMKPNRRADTRSVVGLLSDYKNRRSKEALLLQAGVPMLVSNHIDPFAGSNICQFEPIWELCVELGIELAWQTRGAHKPHLKVQEKIIKETPKSFWYVSIPMIDDSVRAKIEPHAPTIGSRLDLVDQLIGAGHVVVVGINPLCIEWMPDFEPLIDTLKNRGVWGVWVEPLYFGKMFKNNIPSKDRQILGERLIQNSGEVGSAVDGKHVIDCIDYALSSGMEVFNTGYEKPTSFFEPAQKIYKAPMPYWHQVINAIDPDLEGKDNNDLIVLTKQDMINLVNPLPELDWADPLRHKRARHYREITNPVGPLPKQNVASFFDIIWNDELFCRSLGLLKYPMFSYASVLDKKTVYPLLDDNGDRLIVYKREGWAEYYANTPEIA